MLPFRKTPPAFERRSRLLFEWRTLLSSSANEERGSLRLFLASATAAAPSWFLLAIRARRDHSRRVSRRRCCTLRDDPELHEQLRKTSTVHHDDATGVDAASVHKV